MQQPAVALAWAEAGSEKCCLTGNYCDHLVFILDGNLIFIRHKSSASTSPQHQVNSERLLSVSSQYEPPPFPHPTPPDQVDTAPGELSGQPPRHHQSRRVNRHLTGQPQSSKHHTTHQTAKRHLKHSTPSSQPTSSPTLQSTGTALQLPPLPLPLIQVCQLPSPLLDLPMRASITAVPRRKRTPTGSERNPRPGYHSDSAYPGMLPFHIYTPRYHQPFFAYTSSHRGVSIIDRERRRGRRGRALRRPRTPRRPQHRSDRLTHGQHNNAASCCSLQPGPWRRYRAERPR